MQKSRTRIVVKNVPIIEAACFFSKMTSFATKTKWFDCVCEMFTEFFTYETLILLEARILILLAESTGAKMKFFNRSRLCNLIPLVLAIFLQEVLLPTLTKNLLNSLND